ncbi:hypothetical protein [Actinophytocola sp. NPDC049390]|uniref:hypothetical protein n=1 Tax=Actinophytocola sp. NPDC049390 TaxID=3363894 RepID=UPI0037A99E1A
MIGGDSRYSVRVNEAFEQGRRQGEYANQLRDATDAGFQDVMYMREYFGDGYDEALMGAEHNKKLGNSQADGHDMHKLAHNDAGHIAVDVVSYCKRLF